MGAYTLHLSQVETSSGMSSSQLMSVHTCVGVYVNVTAVSGTLPGLVIKLQNSPDGITWFDVPNVVSNTIGATGSYNLSPAVGQSVADYVRSNWTISGVDASFTFDIQLVVIGS